MAAFDDFHAAAGRLSPKAAVVLGSGLGPVVERMTVAAEVKFADVPGLAAPTVHGHGGRVIAGTWAGVPVLVFQGRMHFYEGHTWERATAAVRLAAELGVTRLVLTNAAGGIRDDLNPGDLMAIRGHVKLLDAAAWKRVAESREPGLPKSGFDFGSRSPAGTFVADDVGPVADPTSEVEAGLRKSAPYAPSLLAVLQRSLPAGVYAALTGPTYETPAEIRALRAMGADAVGMSTAMEAEAAANLGLEVAAISCITNKAAGLSSAALAHSEVAEVAGRADVVTRLANLLDRLVVEGIPRCS